MNKSRLSLVSRGNPINQILRILLINILFTYSALFFFFVPFSFAFAIIFSDAFSCRHNNLLTFWKITPHSDKMSQSKFDYSTMITGWFEGKCIWYDKIKGKMIKVGHTVYINNSTVHTLYHKLMPGCHCRDRRIFSSSLHSLHSAS